LFIKLYTKTGSFTTSEKEARSYAYQKYVLYLIYKSIHNWNSISKHSPFFSTSKEAFKGKFW